MSLAFTTFLSLVLACCCYYAFGQIPFIRRSLRLGAAFWAKWLPVASVILLVLLLLDGVVEKNLFGQKLGLQGAFGKAEIVTIFFLVMASLLRFGNLIGCAITIYAAFRFANATGIHPAGGACFLLASGLLMMLGDRIPWYPRRYDLILLRAKQALLVVSIGSVLLMLGIGVFKINAFSKWLYLQYQFPHVPFFLFLMIGFFVFAWMAIGFELIGKLLIFALCPLTLAVIYFVTGLPSYLLAMPLAIFVGSAMSIGEVRVTRLPTT